MENIFEIIKTYVTPIALIIIFIIGLIYLLKYMIEKIIDNVLSKKYSKKVVDYENTINRRTIVYKILLERELELYSNYFSYASSLITDIQNVQNNYDNLLNDNKEKEPIEKKIVRILILIQKLNHDIILYKSYCDKRVYDELVKLITLTDDYLEKKLDKKITKDKKEIDKMSNELISQLSLTITMMHEREKEMLEKEII